MVFSLLQAKIIGILVIVIGGTLLGSRYFNKAKAWHYKRRAGKLEKRLAECYQLKAESNISDKLQNCLIKAGIKERKIKKCYKKYHKAQ